MLHHSKGKKKNASGGKSNETLLQLPYPPAQKDDSDPHSSSNELRAEHTYGKNKPYMELNAPERKTFSPLAEGGDDHRGVKAPASKQNQHRGLPDGSN
jgi:hypothetical protein